MKRQKTKRGFDPDWEVEQINRVKDYVRMEYGDEMYHKISTSKFINILTGYVTNCLSMRQPNKYTIPFMANHIVNFVRKSY